MDTIAVKIRVIIEDKIKVNFYMVNDSNLGVILFLEVEVFKHLLGTNVLIEIILNT